MGLSNLGTNENEFIPFNKINQIPVFAEKVEVGDCLYVLSNKQKHTFEQKRVQKVDIVEETGIYAPMTSNGDIIVNDIYASCYNILNNKIMQHSFVDNLRHLPSIGWIFGENSENKEQMVNQIILIYFKDQLITTVFRLTCLMEQV